MAPQDSQDDTAPHHDRRLSEPLHRLITAATRWLGGTYRREPEFPRHTIPFASRLRDALADPRFADRIYRGIRRHETLVLVEEQDGSQRLLRDNEARARAQFEWGYGGTGPTTLAEFLSIDMLDELARCPACLGGVACSAKLVRRRECRGTGFTPELREFPLFVDERIEKLPTSVQPSKPGRGYWTWSRREMLEHASKTAG